MTYHETLMALLDATKYTTIFGMFGYNDTDPDDYIGFRRECCWSDLKDPVIGGTTFMLCADAYDTEKDCKIKSVEQLYATPNKDVRIDLRAVSFHPSYVTIRLGSYTVYQMMKYSAKGGNDWDFCVRLDIGRNE